MPSQLLKLIFAGMLMLPLGLRAVPLETSILTNIAVRFKLPCPPKDSRLVLAHTGSWNVLGNQSTSRDPGIYSPAFLLGEMTNESIVVLRGTERQTVEFVRNDPLWRPFSTADIEPKPGGYDVSFDRLSAFVCAVQLAMRGEDSAAQIVWQRFARDSATNSWNEDYGHFYGDFSAQLKNPPLMLATCLFNHFRGQVLQQPSNWPVIQTQMAALFAEFPALKDDRRNRVFDGLTAAVNAKPPTPGSTEALLLDWSKRPSTTPIINAMSLDDLFDESDAAKAPARTIVLRGAAAVPDLIALMGDQRITAHEIQVMNAPSHIGRVGELALVLLEEITGIRESSSWQTPDAAVFHAWLAQRDKIGEEEILAESVFKRDAGRIADVYETPARELAQKFPERLIALLAEFSTNATEEAQPFYLAEALATSHLTKEVKAQTLAEMAQRGTLDQKREILQVLAEIDQKKCAELLAPLLEKMPRDPDGPYWTCPEAGFTHVVMLIEDDAIWREYIQIARQSSVGLRMEMMNPLDYSYIKDKNKARRIAFLAAFLNDENLRDLSSDSKRFDGPCAAFTIPKITVRNFAAMQIASILELPDLPDEFWTAAQWDGLRVKVTERLTAEKIPLLN